MDGTNELAKELLIKISNSLHERPEKIEICFSAKEIQLVEDWIKSLLNYQNAQSPT